MAINYHVIEKHNPGDPEAPKKFYASTVLGGHAGTDVLIRRIEKLSTMSGGDIRGVIYTLIDVVPELLEEGKKVEIGELGSFSVSISSTGSETEEEVSAANIRKAKILFSPGKKFKQMLNNLEYHKVPRNGGT